MKSNNKRDKTNDYEFKKWAWRKNKVNDLKTMTICENYIPGTNNIYDSYLFRNDCNNMYRVNLERDLADMEFYISMFNKTSDETYMNMYYSTIDHYTELLNKYNKLYPKYDDVIIYDSKHKRYIYPTDWE